MSAGPATPPPDPGTTDVVLLGIGNILLSDEGVGVRVVEELARAYAFAPAIRVIDGGTAGMDLLPELAGADHLLIVDAVCAGRRPGALLRLAGADLPQFFATRVSPHQVGIAEVLAALRILDEAPGETVVIGVEPDSFAMNLALSPAVAAALPQAMAAVLGELQRIGIRASRLPG